MKFDFVTSNKLKKVQQQPVPLTSEFLSLQILDSEDFEEFSTKPLDSLRPQDSSLINASEGQLAPAVLDSLGQHLEMGLGTGVISGPAVSSGLELDLRSGAAVGSSLGTGFDFGSGVCMGALVGPEAGTGVSSMDPETQRRLSLQEPQTPLDSRTPHRHSSDPGGS